ncbi:MAG: glutamine amidotransferase-related protein [Archangium sp.]
MKKKLLLLKAGVTSSRAVLGDYELWFQRGCGDVALTTIEAHEGAALPDVREFDGVLVSGSPRSVTTPEPWMERLADAMVDAESAHRAVLGVCFGHQLLAWRHGARVERNPLGRELGTVWVELTERGRSSALFADFPARFEMQATHDDMVVACDSLNVLATSERCAVQAISTSERCFGVQFHPEMDEASIRFCIEHPDTRSCDRERAQSRETPLGTRLLRRFVELCG